MALYRDVTSLSYAGASASTLGACQEVNLECGADEIEHSGCDSDAIQYRGVTGQFFTATIEVAGGTEFLRDALDLSWAASYPDLLTFEIAETSEEIVDDSDGDCWITFVGVKNRAVEASATLRDICAVKADAETGVVASLSAKARNGSALGPGCDDGGATTTFSAALMMLVSCGFRPRHGELAEASMEWKSTGAVTEFTGGIVFGGVHVGEDDTFSFSVPSAEGGADCDFSLENAVLQEKRVSLAQGEMARETLTLKAYSSDGATSPLS